MGTLIAVYALIAIGFLLCFIGKFPGQILAFAGMLVAYFGLQIPYPVWLLILCGVLVVLSIIVNKTLVPKVAKKVHEYGKPGRIGTTIGSLIAILCAMGISNGIVVIILLLILPYVFAFIFEFASKKNASEGAQRAVGAYTVFMVSTLINIAICTFCLMKVVYGWA